MSQSKGETAHEGSLYLLTKTNHSANGNLHDFIRSNMIRTFDIVRTSFQYSSVQCALTLVNDKNVRLTDRKKTSETKQRNSSVLLSQSLDVVFRKYHYARKRCKMY